MILKFVKISHPACLKDKNCIKRSSYVNSVLTILIVSHTAKKLKQKMFIKVQRFWVFPQFRNGYKTFRNPSMNK